MATQSTQHVNGNGRNAKAVAAKHGRGTQAASGTREEKGREIFAMGAVREIGSGLYRVKDYRVDMRNVECDCEDKKFNLKDGEPCKHLYAAKLFIEAHDQAAAKAEPFYSKKIMTYKTGGDAQKAAPKGTAQAVKSFDKETRMAAVNSAVAILSTHNEPITFDQVVELASQLELWTATGKAKPTQSAAEKYAYMYE